MAKNSNGHMSNPFVPAKKRQLPLKMALYGPSGSGKTYTALLIAEVLAGDSGKIAVIDSEGRSSELYADRFTFDVLDLSAQGYDPQNYINAINAAEAFGYSVVVIDSLTHAWNGTGGVLEIVDRAAEQDFRGNKWAGWSKGRPAHNALIQTVNSARIHILGLMRSKTEWSVDKDASGRDKITKIGTAPIQDGDVEYEFSIAGLLSMNHGITWTKSRCPHVTEGTVTDATESSPELKVTIQQVKAWLGEGEAPTNTVIEWTEEQAKQFVAHWRAQGFTDDQMLGILDIRKFGEWKKGRSAADQAMIRAKAQQPIQGEPGPAQGETGPALDEVGAARALKIQNAMAKHCERFYGVLDVQALEWLDVEDWGAFKDEQQAIEALWAAAKAGEQPVRVYTATAHSKGQIDLHGPSGEPIRVGLTKLRLDPDWDDFVNTWQKDSTYDFERDGKLSGLIVSYKFEGGAIKVTELLQISLAEAPF